MCKIGRNFKIQRPNYKYWIVDSDCKMMIDEFMESFVCNWKIKVQDHTKKGLKMSIRWKGDQNTHTHLTIVTMVHMHRIIGCVYKDQVWRTRKQLMASIYTYTKVPSACMVKKNLAKHGNFSFSIKTLLKLNFDKILT